MTRAISRMSAGLALILTLVVSSGQVDACWWPFFGGGYGYGYPPAPTYGVGRPYYGTPGFYSAGYSPGFYSAGYYPSASYGGWNAGYNSPCCAAACCSPCDPCGSCCAGGSCAGGSCGAAGTGSGTLKPQTDPGFSGGTDRRREPEAPPRTYEEPRDLDLNADPVPPVERDPLDDFGTPATRPGALDSLDPGNAPPARDNLDDPATPMPFDDILNSGGAIQPFDEDPRTSNKPPMTEPVNGATPADAGSTPAESATDPADTATDPAVSNPAGTTGDPEGTTEDGQSQLSIPAESLSLRMGTHHEVLSPQRLVGNARNARPQASVATKKAPQPVRWISAPSAANVVRL